MLSSALVVAALVGSADAGTMLEPQVRVHVGANYVGGPSPFGVSLGLDARLTRIVGIDLGGFASPVPIAADEFVTQAKDEDYFHLRHGVYVAPGLRIPHAQPRAWAWEVFVRGGAGVIWFADTDPDAYPVGDEPYAITPGIGGFGGADAFVRVGHFGVRVLGRAWVYEGQHRQPGTPAMLVQPQIAVEGIVQF